MGDDDAKTSALDLAPDERGIHALFDQVRTRVTRVSEGFSRRVQAATSRSRRGTKNPSLLGLFGGGVIQALNMLAAATRTSNRGDGDDT